MMQLAEELRNKLNALCFPVLDGRVEYITEETLRIIQFNVSFGFGLMINRSTFPIDNEKK
jgi:hypothetical protein